MTCFKCICIKENAIIQHFIWFLLPCFFLRYKKEQKLNSLAIFKFKAIYTLIKSLKFKSSLHHCIVLLIVKRNSFANFPSSKFSKEFKLNKSSTWQSVLQTTNSIFPIMRNLKGGSTSRAVKLAQSWSSWRAIPSAASSRDWLDDLWRVLEFHGIFVIITILKTLY